VSQNKRASENTDANRYENDMLHSLFLVPAEGDADLLVKQPMEGFRPGSDTPECAILGDFRAGVNEAPCGGTNALSYFSVVSV
jgi:hypothetical protein